jgi:hypothetical protein
VLVNPERRTTFDRYGSVRLAVVLGAVGRE